MNANRSRSDWKIASADRILGPILHFLTLITVPLFRQVTLLDTIEMKPFPFTVQILTEDHIAIWGLPTVTKPILLWIIQKILPLFNPRIQRRCRHQFPLFQVINQLLNGHLLQIRQLYLLNTHLLQYLRPYLSLQHLKILSYFCR